MEATVTGPADPTVSYLVTTRHTKDGVPKVLGLPRSGNTPASSVDESLTFPAIRPGRNASSNSRRSSVSTSSSQTASASSRGARHHRHDQARLHVSYTLNPNP